MAKINNKRAARMEQNNRNMNRTLELLTAGFLAEFYLLMVNNYFVRGTISQLAAVATALEYMVYVGIALVLAGVVLLFVNRKKDKGLTKTNKWLIIAGVFFTLSSELMLTVYPQGTTAMCIFVPVVMILGVIFLLYQREFSVQTVALVISITAMFLLGRGAGKANWALIVKGYSVAAIAVLLVMLFLTYTAQKNGGAVKGIAVFPAKTDYKMVYAVLAVCVAAILAALLVGSVAFYGVWVLSIALFVLAVYYTVKML